MQVEMIMLIVQTLVTIVLGFVGWSLKATLADLRKDIDKNAADVAATQKELADLKADLPIVYTLKEDFIRTMNNVEDKISEAIHKIDKILLK